MEKIFHLIIFGRQGSGKGTQCEHLSKELGVIHISTGDVLRRNIASETELGLKVKPLLAEGLLVDDDTILELVEDRLSNEDVKEAGFILDGFPRTVKQAHGLLDHIGVENIDLAINLEVSKEEVMKRILARGRHDDVAESIESRLKLYEDETVPVIEMFDDLGLLRTVDGLGSQDVITKRILQVVNNL